MSRMARSTPRIQRSKPLKVRTNNVASVPRPCRIGIPTIMAVVTILPPLLFLEPGLGVEKASGKEPTQMNGAENQLKPDIELRIAHVAVTAGGIAIAYSVGTTVPVYLVESSRLP